LFWSSLPIEKILNDWKIKKKVRQKFI